MAARLANLTAVLVLVAFNGFAAAPTRLTLHIDSVASTKTNFTVRLKGADARQQLLATAELDSGMLVDLTRHVTYESSSEEIVRVTSAGLVIWKKAGPLWRSAIMHSSVPE